MLSLCNSVKSASDNITRDVLSVTLVNHKLYVFIAACLSDCTHTVSQTVVHCHETDRFKSSFIVDIVDVTSTITTGS